MIKKIAVTTIVAVLIGYFVFAYAFPRTTPPKVCQAVEYLISDTTLTASIRASEVATLLRRHHLYPVGLPLDSVPCHQIEQCLRQVPSIAHVECYISQAHRVCIAIEGRTPILRVMSNNGERYYVDKQGDIMPEGNCVAYTPIATGNITRQTAIDDLYPLAQYLQSDPFWLAQITQIDVDAKHQVTLIPRVGSQRLFLGKPTDYKHKLARIKAFYLKGVNQIGWNKYSKINVEFSNQIICTRK